MTSTADLEARKQKIHATFSKADAALHLGKVTQQERDAILNAYYGTADEREAILPLSRELEYQRLRATPEPRISKTTLLVIGFCILMTSLFAMLFYSTGGITGALVMEQTINTTYFTNTTIPLELTAATRINITGTAQGEGNIIITLIENGQRHPMYAFRHAGVQTAHASMPKSRYTESETVAYAAVNVSSAYLMTGEQAIPLDADTTAIENLTAGSYVLKLIINETDGNSTALSQEALQFSVVEQGAPAASEAFNTCGSACDVNITANATLEIATDGDATLTLGSIIISSEGNRPPQLAHDIPDVTAEGTARIDISQAFSDPDADPLYFDVTHHDGMEERIENGILTVSGEPGARTYIVYASDLRELTPSNIFSITITVPNISAQSNGTQSNATDSNETTGETTGLNDTLQTGGTTDGTSDPTNSTANSMTGTSTTNVTTNAPANTTPVNTTANTTNISIAPEEPCGNPDPNLRPLSCIQGDNSSYFKPEEIIIDNKNAVPVGQITPVGNLLIRGGLVEHSAGQPQPSDYQLGYTDQNGDFVATLWIDTATGDLHLRGSLIEANGNIPGRDGYSAFINKRGIILALLDAHTGDLIVRGNLVPYRRVIG